MPQLVPGGKWVFGWVVVGPRGELPVPPAAWEEYGFRAGDEVLFIRGSRRSGGFGLSHRRLWSGARVRMDMERRILGRGLALEGGGVQLPAGLGVQGGDRLLVVRGSGRALGLVSRGPIYREALGHLELGCYGEGGGSGGGGG